VPHAPLRNQNCCTQHSTLHKKNLAAGKIVSNYTTVARLSSLVRHLVFSAHVCTTCDSLVVGPSPVILFVSPQRDGDGDNCTERSQADGRGQRKQSVALCCTEFLQPCQKRTCLVILGLILLLHWLHCFEPFASARPIGQEVVEQRKFQTASWRLYFDTAPWFLLVY
jgi:hypothetical protein